MRVTTAKPVASAVASPADLDVAVEVFVRGYSFTRSFTYPYHAERVVPPRAEITDPRYLFSLTAEENWIVS